MIFQSGVVLPFFLIAVPIVLAFVDLLGTAKSTSALTQGSASVRPDHPVPHDSPAHVPN